ncbi:MAG: DUF4302 domain-containing protein [Bacteroidaceae bacterium]|nr:DUF4302 domain-containing protein [Bacteroidaceae bacterium]
MKKIYLFLMVAVLALAQTSCSSDDRVFDDSSANRMENALNEYRELLVSAENGWCLEMFPGEEQEYLGTSIYLKFDKDGKVTATGDFPMIDGYDCGDLFESRYELIKQQGPLLSFVTYNPFIHAWSEPSSSDVDGYESDYEFVVTKASATEFELKGRKRNVTLRMYALDKSVDWKKSCEELYAMREKCAALKTIALYSGSKKLGNGKITGADFRVSGENGVYKASFLATKTGIKFYAPINIDGNLVSEFTYDETAKELKAVGADVKIVFERPADYIDLETYLNGDWNLSFTYYASSKEYKYNKKTKFTLNEDGTLTMTGAHFPIVCKYDDSTGMISINTQYLAMLEEGAYLFLCQCNGRSLTWDFKSGFDGYTSSLTDSQQVIKFKDNGMGVDNANSFYLYVFTSSKPSGDTMDGTYTYYKDITLTLTK